MFLKKNGVNLFYSIKGTGDPALVFVHGWLGSHGVWKEQVAEFSQTHTVVSIDLRGFGESDKPEGEYTLDVFAADLDFMIQELGLAKPILIGWSMGGAIGLVYATAHPDKISKLVLVGSTPLLIATEDYPHAIPGEAAEQLLEAMNTNFSTGARGFVELEFPEPGTEGLKDMAHAITQQTTLEVALNSIGPAAGRDLRPLLSQVKMPTLILSGGQDQVCLPAASQYMHEHISNSELHLFAGKGHLPFLTDTQAFNERLRGFIAS
jgi:pimeloyl-ACP methyl ester esterase